MKFNELFFFTLLFFFLSFQNSFPQNVEDTSTKIDSLINSEDYQTALGICKNLEKYSSNTRKQEIELLPILENAMLIVIELFELSNDKKYLHTAFDFSERSRIISISESYQNTATVLDVQAMLRDSQALISYFISEKALITFKILKDDIEVIIKEGNLELDFWVEELYGNLHEYFESPNQTDVLYRSTGAYYTQAAYDLYYHLVLPLKELPKDLIIIPSGVLNYIPFEVLLTNPVEIPWNFNTHPYLLKKHSFLYCYSATLLREMRQKKNTAPIRNVLAYAPSFLTNPLINPENETLRGDLSPLKYNLLEVQAIQEIHSVELISEKEASFQAFIGEAPKYNVLHCATAALINDRQVDSSFIAFTDKDSNNVFLYAKDLREIKLNADLVTLSAAEMGIEKLYTGEGIQHFTYDFSKAGVSSLMTTFWSINDRKTPGLMKSFYQNLKSGMTKDNALREAKLAYLKKGNLFDCHPYFWASTIPIGDMSAIEIKEEKPNNFWVFGFGILIVSLIIFLIFKKKT